MSATDRLESAARSIGMADGASIVRAVARAALTGVNAAIDAIDRGDPATARRILAGGVPFLRKHAGLE